MDDCLFILVIAVYALLIIYEFIPLYKQKFWNDFWVNAVLCFFSFIFAILISLNIKIPSPEKPIREFITSIFGK